MKHGLILLTLVLVGCGDSSPASPEHRALLEVKAFIDRNIADLLDASQKLQAAAPAPDDDGWNATADAGAVEQMRTQWKRSRTAYENIEGAIAVLFPDIDIAIDQRYDGFLSVYGPDTDLFDDQNVTGVHALERILWSDSIPQTVLTFEMALPGYKAAAFPKSRAEADAFKNKLCARLVRDITTMRDQFAPLALDPAAAYRGVIGSMKEQLEKAEKAATGEEESRYAQYTLADMRINVDAGVQTFAAFKPWLRSKNTSDLISRIEADYARVQAAYDMLSGDALPPVPSNWSSQNPSAADLQTPFGKLWTVLHHEADGTMQDTLVFDLNASAAVLGIPELPQ